MLRVALAVAAALALTACAAEQDRGIARGTVGYTVLPPEGWEDLTREVAAESEAPFDVAYGGRVVDGTRVSLNIARRDVRQGARLVDLVQAGRREVDALGGGGIEFTRAVRTQVDREPALRYDFTANGRRVRQVGTIHDGGYFVVTLTAADSAFDRAVPALDSLLRSWRWD